MLVFGVILLAFPTLCLSIANGLLSLVPYQVTEYWKVDKAVYPPTSGISSSYMMAWQCSSAWQGSSWIPIQPAKDASSVLSNLKKANSNLSSATLISSNEDSSYYYFILSVTYYKTINGQVAFAMYEENGQLWNPQGQGLELDACIVTTQQVYVFTFASGESNPDVYEFPPNTYIFWCRVFTNMADDSTYRRSGNSTAVAVADGGTYSVSLTLASQPSEPEVTNGVVVMTTCEQDGSLHQGEVDYYIYYASTQQPFKVILTTANPATVELPPDTYMIWASSEDQRQSEKATVTVVNGGYNELTFTLSPQPPSQPPPQNPPLPETHAFDASPYAVTVTALGAVVLTFGVWSNKES